MLKYLLPLLVCIAGCGFGNEADQAIISESAPKMFTAKVLSVERGQSPTKVAVIQLTNGSLWSLVAPFDEYTDTHAKLAIGDEILIDYVLLYETQFRKGKLIGTMQPIPAYTIKHVTFVPPMPCTNGPAFTTPGLKYEDLFK